MGSLGRKSRDQTLEQGSLVLRVAPHAVAGLESDIAGAFECAEPWVPQGDAIVIHTDGLCEPINPGGIATAAWVSKRLGEVVGMGYRVVAVGEGATGNVAEYWAIIDALQWAAAHGFGGVQIRSDSQMCVSQINGNWQVKSPLLQPLCARAQELVAKTGASVVWVPRRQNGDADSLSVKAWEQYTGKRLAQRYGKAGRAKRWGHGRVSQKHAPVSVCTATEGRPGEGPAGA